MALLVPVEFKCESAALRSTPPTQFTTMKQAQKTSGEDDVNSLKAKVQSLQDRLKTTTAAEALHTEELKRSKEQSERLQKQLKAVELWEPYLMEHLESGMLLNTHPNTVV